tara:strand:+ start:165 stop:980 length:816 start_codon:yes stop_codon:yes gene_type:complete
MKQINFLTGFPRSGNTLLASILNQNQNIATTGHSSVASMFYSLDHLKVNSPIYNNYKNHECFENVEEKLLQTHYAPWKQKIIIDRGEWCTPFNFFSLQKYGPSNPKIIFLLRDPLEVIQSYLHVCENYPNFYVNQSYDSMDPTTLYRTEIEEKIDLITAKNGLFDFMCMSYNFVIKNNLHKKCVKFINYKDMVTKPEKTFKNIYKFLNIPYYKHTFNVDHNLIVNGVTYDDELLGAPLHALILGKVKNPSRYNIKLPKSTIFKYKNFFKHD